MRIRAEAGRIKHTSFAAEVVASFSACTAKMEGMVMTPWRERQMLVK